MKILLLVFISVFGIAAASGFARGQHSHGHDHMKGAGTPMKHARKIAPKSALKPAEGASVKIISPKSGENFNGDLVPLEFELKKGKRGEHVHAHVDGELMGMFNSSKGTLTGIKPGQHTLELRVATQDHNTELDATDRIDFLSNNGAAMNLANENDLATVPPAGSFKRTIPSR
ncbi:MAG: hypothetical protein OEN50_18495, partial [Deltaproteobacteria bacterium]|nr:hypothetical protein [Deltaproteobacteria bacterium]